MYFKRADVQIAWPANREQTAATTVLSTLVTRRGDERIWAGHSV